MNTRELMRTSWRPPRLPGLSGVGGMGAVDKGGLRFTDNAVIAPQFDDGKPGRYSIDVVVVGVPMTAEKRRYFDPAEWNDSLRAAGYNGVDVEKVEFVATGAAANPRSTGGALDIFGWGVEVADYTYRLTVRVSPRPAGVDGLGAVTTAGWLLIGAAVVAVNLLIYKLSGTDILVSTVKYLGEVLGAVGGAAAAGALPVIVPLLVVVGVALFAFTKMGGKASYKGFSVGK